MNYCTVDQLDELIYDDMNRSKYPECILKNADNQITVKLFSRDKSSNFCHGFVIPEKETRVIYHIGDIYSVDGKLYSENAICI